MIETTRPKRRRVESWILTVAVTAFLTMGVAGCSPSLGSVPCMPPEYEVNPSSAKPGEVVKVSAPDATCNPRYGRNAQVRIVFTDANGVEVLNTTAPMSDAGGFVFSAEVPLHTAMGMATVYAAPEGVDWCDDTGTNNRAGPGTAELEMASCAEPMKPLNITK
jgi:hypothetical protein